MSADRFLTGAALIKTTSLLRSDIMETVRSAVRTNEAGYWILVTGN